MATAAGPDHIPASRPAPSIAAVRLVAGAEGGAATLRDVVCVDLDGTLIAADTLWESAVALVRWQPAMLIALVLWALQGRARLKREVATRVPTDPAALPYRGEVLSLLRHCHESGRRIVLATAADAATAQRVADHLGFFDQVLASDGDRNLAKGEKARALAAAFGEGGFDYVGNDAPDIPAWQAAGRAVLAGARPALARRVSRAMPVVLEIDPRVSGWRAGLRALRPHQWVKNVLVFLPVIAAHAVLEPVTLAASFAAFAAFSLCASSVYLMNDALDVESDRLHPRKRHRPIAAGQLSVPAAVFGSVMLAAAALALSWFMSAGLAVVLGLYVVLTTVYSAYLKRKPVLDVLVLGALYVWRVAAGGVAARIELSTWMMAFALFFFLSLAFVKRHAEVLASASPSEVRGRGYSTQDAVWMQTVGIVCGVAAVLVLALYVTAPEVSSLYSRPRVLWLLCPVVLYWTLNLWFRASRGLLIDDPLLEAARDPNSYAVAALSAAVLFAAS